MMWLRSAQLLHHSSAVHSCLSGVVGAPDMAGQLFVSWLAAVVGHRVSHCLLQLAFCMLSSPEATCRQLHGACLRLHATSQAHILAMGAAGRQVKAWDCRHLLHKVGSKRCNS